MRSGQPFREQAIKYFTLIKPPPNNADTHFMRQFCGVPRGNILSDPKKVLFRADLIGC